MERSHDDFRYEVRRLTEPFEIDGDWDKQQWQDINPVRLENFMGERPVHFPETEFRLCYDEKYIYVIFRVKDRYVRAVASQTNGKVWLDSCVEFFFTPGPDVDQGYFNLETNCGGTILFKHNSLNMGLSGFVDTTDCSQIKIVHSLPEIITEEIQEPLTWTLEYRLPLEIIEKYMQLEKPAPGVEWRANFYKCADMSSHPHWLTWTKVDFPSPKFHLPAYFGWLVFK